MNYLTFINHISQKSKYPLNINYLVSGIDETIQDTVLTDILINVRNKNLIIIDDTGTFSYYKDHESIKRYNFEIENGFTGDYYLYNPFHIHSIIDISKIRQLFDILEYDENKKGKLISYLNFIIHLENLEGGNCNLDINKLSEYSTVLSVERKILKLLQKNVITQEHQMILLSKYSECASAGADLENTFYTLMPFVSGRKDIQSVSNKILVFPINNFDDDMNIKKIILQLLKFELDSNSNRNISLLILDKGRGERKYLSHFIESIPLNTDVHIFSEDIFTLEDEEGLSHILNRFNVKIYGKHLTMSSAQSIEKACGEVEVIRQEKTITHDRRLFANKPFDIILGHNKVESFVKMPPVREPKYHKEMIMKFPSGKGIIDFNGNTTIFSL